MFSSKKLEKNKTIYFMLIFDKKRLNNYQNVGLISVPIGRFQKNLLNEDKKPASNLNSSNRCWFFHFIACVILSFASKQSLLLLHPVRCGQPPFLLVVSLRILYLLRQPLMPLMTFQYRLHIST